MIKNPVKKWISTEEQLPPDLQEVLYFAINSLGGREIMTGHRKNGQWTHCCLWYSTQILNEDSKVTHWMELPDYPQNIITIKDYLPNE